MAPTGEARQALGRRGEELAARALQLCGMQIIERNWRCRRGEIDIVAREPQNDTTVFVEVKCRSGLGFGDPLEAITREKVRRLRQLAGLWLAEHEYSCRSIRLDAVGIVWGPDQLPRLSHVRGIGS